MIFKNIQRYISVLGVLVLLAIVFSPNMFVEGQNNTNRLTRSQMNNAPVIDTVNQIPALELNASQVLNSQNQRSQVYRLSSCNQDDNTSVCYISRVFETSTSGTDIVALAGFSATQKCGYSLYSLAGLEVARLQQQINVTYSGSTAKLPARLNWGNLGGSWATWPYNWENTHGPTPNVSWGVTSSNTIYITADGEHRSIAGGGAVYSTTMTINSTGTYCS